MIVETLILIVYSNSKPIAYFLLTIVTLALWITSVAVAVSHNLHALVGPDLYNIMYYWYFKTNTRMVVHLYGFFLGLVYSESTTYEHFSKRMDNVKIIIVYVIGVIFIFFCILLDNVGAGNTFYAFWLGSSKLLYVTGLWFICFPSLMGASDIISRTMRNRFFVFISKISISIYFMQASIVKIKNYRRHYSLHVDSDSMLEGTLSSIMIVLMFSIIFALTIQIPLYNMVDLMFINSAGTERVKKGSGLRNSKQKVKAKAKKKSAREISYRDSEMAELESSSKTPVPKMINTTENDDESSYPMPVTLANPFATPARPKNTVPAVTKKAKNSILIES
jgi:hypothetical protein